MPIDASIPLGFKQTDPMQSLSGLLNVAKTQQDVQNNAITLQQRQGMLDYLKSGDAMDPDGSLNQQRLMTNAAKYGDTGLEIAKKAAEGHQQATAASSAWNKLGAEKAGLIGQSVMALPKDAQPELVNKLFDTLDQQYKGPATPITTFFRNLYNNAESHQGPGAGRQAVVAFAKSQMGPTAQQTFDTPNANLLDDGQKAALVNTKPDLPAIPVGGVVPGTLVQKQLPPNTPTVGPNNQPGYLGPQGPAATQPIPGQVQPSVRAAFNKEAGAAFPNNNIGPDTLRTMQQELAAEQAKGPNANPQLVAGLQREIARAQQVVGGQGGFVPSGPVPGANESKASSVAVMNDHWNGLNKSSENSQLLEGLLGNIKSLASGAITGTEAGRKTYLNGLLNALHLGNQATGDMQRDTDLLEKNIAQLGLNTPASTDAMRTIVGAARPHSTMSKDAIEEAAAQLTGQIQANRAIRNALTVPKQIADQTGDPSVYQTTKAHMEEVADPRAWQFESLSSEGRAKMLSALKPDDRAALRAKIKTLIDMGLLK